MSDYPRIVYINPRVLRIEIENIYAGWEKWVLLMSDQHHDSPYCNRKLEKETLDRALERNAIILFGGDVFDAMQGKFDPRRSLDSVRPEDKRTDYLDSIVRHAIEDYKQYANNIYAIGMGNHENSVLANNNTNLISSLVHGLNAHVTREDKIIPLGISGYIEIRCFIQKTVSQTINIKYHHGADGTAPVTKGVIHTNRQGIWLPDADVIWNGHNHNAYHVPITRERKSLQGNIYYDVCHFIRTPGYKNEYLIRPDEQGLAATYSDLKNMQPTPNGCAWLRLYHSHKSHIAVDVMIDVH